MEDIVIVEAVRSAVGRAAKGSLATKRPDELAADVIRGLLRRVPQLKGKVDDALDNRPQEKAKDAVEDDKDAVEDATN